MPAVTGRNLCLRPESQLCIVYGPGEIMDAADCLSDEYNQAPYVTIDGAISVGADSDGKNPEADQASWRIRGRSGEAMKCSSKDDHGIEYNVQLEPVANQYHGALDVDYIVNVTWRDHTYTNEPKVQEGSPCPGVTVAPGARVTIKFGETPDGHGLYLHISAKAKLLPPPPRIADISAVRKFILSEIAKK